MEFRLATRGDISDIIRLRVDFLKEMNANQKQSDESRLQYELERYLRAHLGRDYVNWFAMEGSYIVATGGICFHDYPPSFEFLNSTRAYIVNIYTVKANRGKGIATKIIEKLVAEAKRRKVSAVALHATELGRSIYEKFGFESNQKEMILWMQSKDVMFNPGRDETALP